MSIRHGTFQGARNGGNLWMKDRVRRESSPDNLWVSGLSIGTISRLISRKESSDSVWINRYVYPQMLITLCISGGFGHGA
jgi:hypothetical protein